MYTCPPGRDSKDGFMETFVINETSEDVWPACRQAGLTI